MSENPPEDDDSVEKADVGPDEDGGIDGLADRAKQMLDKVKGDAGDDRGFSVGGRIVDAAGGATGGAAAAAGGLADKARGLIGGAASSSEADVAPAGPDSAPAEPGDGDVETEDEGRAGLGDKIAGAASGLSDKLTGAAGSIVGGAAAAAGEVVERAKASGGPSDASADDDETVSSQTVTTAAAATAGGAAMSATSGGGAGGSGGGSGGSGGGSGGSGGDDDEKLFADIPISGRNQVLWLGLIVAGLLMFGGALVGFFFGDDGSRSFDFGEAIVEADGGPCADVRRALESSSLSSSQRSAVKCTVDGSRVILEGTVNSQSTAVSIGAIARGAGFDSGSFIDNRLAFRTSGSSDDDAGDDDDSDSAADATTTTTTEAATTTTTEPATTTEAPTTTASTEAPVEVVTMWDALNDSGMASQFATIAGALGLQEDLATPGVDRTLFAPSDEAMQLLDDSVLTQLVNDPDAGSALVGYHFLEERLTADDLAALDGQSIQTRTGLPLRITTSGDDIILNEVTRLVSSDYAADNGVVHIIDVVLDPPTVNEVVGLEPIEFEVNSDVITPDGQAELQKAIDFFTDNPDINAVIEGHTDTDGDADANQDLSERRAASVKAFLVQNGIEDGRLSTVGFGETQPILDANGVEDKVRSRRIEFVVQ